MKTVLLFLTMLALTALFFWLRAFPFTEKKVKDPEQTARATVISRRVQSGNPIRSGRSAGFGYTFLVNFRLEDGRELELYAYDTEYGALREGMEGMLTWKGPYFVSFVADCESMAAAI